MTDFSEIIDSSFKRLHKDMIDGLLESTALTVPCTLKYSATKFEDCSNCFTAGTMVKTNTGYKNIEKIQLGDLIYDGKSYNKATYLFSRLYSGKLYNISNTGIKLPGYITPNHKILAIKDFRNKYTQKQWYDPNYILDEQPQEVECQDLKIGDAVIFAKYIEENDTDLKFLETELGSFEVTDDILWMIGLWIAEGHVSKDKYARVSSFCLCQSKEEIFAKRVGKLVNDTFGIIPKYEYRTNSDNLLVNIYSAKLSRWFKKFGLGAKNKAIPDSLWENLTLRQKAKILEGLLDGDGCNFTNEENSIYNRIDFTTISKTLAFQVYDIAYCLGYLPSINYKKEYIDKNNQYHNESWKVIWPKNRKTQKNNVRKIKYGYASIIDKIEEKTDTVAVYNIEVENNHNYIANNIWVCNCIYDPIGGKSSNRFQSGGPTPFYHGVCPVCNGAGKIQTVSTDTIYLMPIWSSKDWVPLTQNTVNMADISVQTLSKITTYAQLVRTSSIIIDTSVTSYGMPEFTRVGRPEICGLGQSTHVITSWKRQ